MKIRSKINPGISTLLLLFIIFMILSLVVFALHSISLLAARRASQVHLSQTVFFAAEGALYETIQHMRKDDNWPDSEITISWPYEDSYFIDGVEIRRTITENSGEYEIVINADHQGIRRKLEATFGRSSASGNPLDIILVIDCSGSMAGPLTEDGQPILLPEDRPINSAREAAENFVNVVINEGSGNDEIGLVKYDTFASLQSGLTEAIDFPVTEIQNLNYRDLSSVFTATNMGSALEEAFKELHDNGRGGNANQVIILFSDGVATAKENCPLIPEPEPPSDPPDANDPCFCVQDPVFDPSSGFSPCLNPGDPSTCGGSLCTNQAINRATIAKSNNGYTIFSILLSNIENPGTEYLGRLALLRASSEPETQQVPPILGEDEDYTFYKETSDPDALEDIFEEIAQLIVNPEFFEYGEVLPEPY